MTAAVSTRPAAPGLAVQPRAGRRERAIERAWIVTIAIAIGALVTIGLWVRHGELHAASGPGGVPIAIGQLTALIGTYAVLVQLLLMSRIAWLEDAIGLDRLARVHRWLGFATVWLLSAHVVFTTVGWAQLQGVSLVKETHDLIFNEPDILMAWIGFLLFLAVAITSVRIARQRLKRQTWYFVHLYAYLAVALAFAHQLAVGSDFTGDRAARVWWIALYVLIAGAILWWRVIQPLLISARHNLRVHGVQPEAPGVVSIILSGRALSQLDARPGQFFLWRFLTRDGWWQAHPFSLSAQPTERRMRITVKRLGDHTTRLQRIKKGTRVFIEGPYGTFTADRRTVRRALFIAGGIGITPLRALLETVGPNDDVVMLYRVVSNDDIIFADELRRFANERGVTVYVVTGSDIGDDQTDRLGVPALRRAVPDIASRDCFVCGPPALVDAVRRRLSMLGVPKRRIHFERFEL
jgi:predicted ferric reductase